ncbi:hypothetical protein JNM05_06625 [bacterium]|nr:hypothetical protein [bacterium]
MKSYIIRGIVGIAFILSFKNIYCQSTKSEIRGEPEAVAEAKAMVETMGGLKIWAEMKSIHFVHDWHFWNRVDSYREDEILDLVDPFSWIEMKSEIYHRIRVYSPENNWNVTDGVFSVATEQQSKAYKNRAPFHIVRIAKGIAVGNPFYEVRIGKGEFRDSRQLEFYGPDGKMGGWIILNAKKEPLVWSVPEYKYTFGPMKSFGNLRMPDWASTGNGAVTYQMISLTGGNQPADSSLFVPPKEYRDKR